MQQSTQSKPASENVIVIYPPTSATDSSITAQELKQKMPSIVPLKDEQKSYSKKHIPLMPQCLYELFKNSGKKETMQCFPLPKLMKRRGHPIDWSKGKQKMIWCFREICTTEAFIESKRHDIPWIPFQRKNQLLLTQQLELFARDIKNDSCKLHDRKIKGGKMLVTVWLQETMAFALDPDLSEPITFEIARFPKLNWYQKMLIRHQHKKFTVPSNK